MNLLNFKSLKLKSKMAAVKKRKTEKIALNIQEDENQALVVLIVEKLSAELNPILEYISRQIAAQEQVALNLNLNLNDVVVKINKLEARFFKLEKEISDLQIHALHGFGLENGTAPYSHW